MSPIKDLTDRLRPPRLGKIRLGEKSEAGYPISRDYFVCPDEVKKVYGEKPQELDIMFISDDIEDVFPTYYKMYGQTTGLKCRGDGITADRLNKDTGEFEEIECRGQECQDYENKQCRRIGALKFLLPKVDGIGIWELDTSSYNSILNIYSMIGPKGLLRALTNGRIRMIPFTLHVEKREVQSPEGKKRKVSILELRCNQVNLAKLMEKAPAITSESPKPAIAESSIKEEKKIQEPEKSKLDQTIEYLDEAPTLKEFNHRLSELTEDINNFRGTEIERFFIEKENIRYRLEEKVET